MLFSSKVFFLGCTLSEEEILSDPENVAKILNWPVPKTVHDMRGILGLASYSWCFIQNFSNSMWPPVAVTKKNKPFHWIKEHQKAFDDIKQALVNLDVIAFQTNDGEFILDTDDIII